MNRSADLEELRRLGASIDKVTDLNDLKPIFFRIEELALQYPRDVELAAGIAAVKAHLVQHGQKLINLKATQQTPAVQPIATQPVPAPPPQIAPQVVPPKTVTPVTPPPPPPPQPVAQKAAVAFNWKRTAIVGAVMGALVFSGIIYTVRNARTEERNMVPGSVPVEVRTIPPGASIRIDNQEKCKSNCKLDLAPGSYQMQAVLLGYESSTSTIVAAKNSQPVEVTLQPLPPWCGCLRIFPRARLCSMTSRLAICRKGSWCLTALRPVTTS